MDDPHYSEKQPPAGDAWKKHELFLLEPKTFLIVVVTSVLTLLVSFLGDNGVRFLTSVVSPVPAHAPYDGMSLPIKQIPNWVKLTENDRTLSFSQLSAEKKLAIPLYNPGHLAIPTTSLTWNNPADDAIRNEKITYPVPYLGSYRLDGIEGGGSHPAIDIKVPVGTPVYAIANGTVTKADNGNGGFGHHIVLQHNDVPRFDNASQSTTYHSSYSHLSQVSVAVDQVVRKGELIGYVGQTGTATTPHLHFQIDTADAPWHPYWPFNTSEMNAAGYSFFEAISNGLGQSNARLYTINPLSYVQQHLNDAGTFVATAGSSDAASQPVAQPVTTPTPAPVAEPVVAADPYKDISFVLKLQQGAVYEPNGSAKIYIQAFDSNGQLLAKPTFTDTISLSLLNSRGSLSTMTLRAQDFSTGIVSGVHVDNLSAGREKVILRYRDREFSSPEFEVIEKLVSPVSTFVISRDKEFVEIGEPVTLTIRALNADQAVITEELSLATPADLGMTAALGILSMPQLASANFVNGQAIVTFTGQQPGLTQFVLIYNGQSFAGPSITVRVPNLQRAAEQAQASAERAAALGDAAAGAEELTGGATEAVPAPVAETAAPAVPVVAESGPFIDIDSLHPYYKEIKALKERGLVAGYNDGTFRPDGQVSRAEAITFILRALDEYVRNDVRELFPDVPLDQWYAKFVTTAYDLGFAKGNPDGTFRPTNTVNLAEFFTMLFVAAKADVDPNIIIQLPDGVTATDWFAPYIQTAITEGVITLKPGETLDPSKPLTRGEVAQLIYRLRELIDAHKF